MSNKVERRFSTSEFRVSKGTDGPTQFIGYAAVFNSPSEDLGGWTEEIDPAAFDAVLKSKPDVRALWNHNPDHPLGRTLAGTLELKTDKKGLAYEVNMPDTQVARDLSVSMERGDVTQSSFAFIVNKDEWSKGKDGSVTRRILDVDSLLDVSPVTYPAYPAATSGVRSILPESMPVEIRSAVMSKRSDDDSDDDTDTTDTTDADTEPILDTTDDPGCECDCEQCMAGACNICSNDDCNDELCNCYNQTRDYMQRRITLLNLATPTFPKAA